MRRASGCDASYWFASVVSQCKSPSASGLRTLASDLLAAAPLISLVTASLQNDKMPICDNTNAAKVTIMLAIPGICRFLDGCVKFTLATREHGGIYVLCLCMEALETLNIWSRVQGYSGL